MAVYSCGWAKNGQLGIGPCPTDLVKDPNLIEGLKGKKIVSIAAGDQSSYAVTDLGDVWCWGRGIEGQLGQGNRRNELSPVRIDALQHEKVIKIVCGGHHCVALTATGRIYIWGKLYKVIESDLNEDLGRLAGMVGLKTDMIQRSINRYLSAGDQDQFQLYTESKSYYELLPRLVVELENEFIVDVAAGYSFSIAVTKSGRVYCWGFNDKSQLGLGHRYNQDRPQLVKELLDKEITSAYCGQQHSLVLTKDGEVWSWGLGVFGQLGLGDAREGLVPREIEFFSKENLKIRKICCGAHHSVALTTDGRIFTWGHGEYGQHGGATEYIDWGTGVAAGKENKFSVPNPLIGLEHKIIVDISCGHLHNCAITSLGECFSWGWGSSGCLGHGNTRFQLVPTQISSFSGEKIIAAAASWKHSLFLKEGSESTFAFDYESLVNNSYLSDIVFLVQNRPIFAHKVIIFSRCDHLRSFIQFTERFVSPENKQYMNDALVIPISGNVTFPVFLGLIQYLYTDHLKLPPHQIPRLGDLAVKYRIPRLSAICERACYVISKLQFQTNQSFFIPNSEFTKQLREVVGSPEFSDIEFCMEDGTIIPGHKSILTRRCNYFSSMLSSGFRESTDGILLRIPIHLNVSTENFLSFLDYLYTGDAAVINNENVVDVIAISDHFMVEQLKQICESLIEQSIEEDNVCFLLETADRYNAPRLKRSCLEFILQSSETFNNIQSHESFKLLGESSPQLLRELDFKASKLNLGRVNRKK